jgi:3',5'-cyclic AMP phosphodiesterase CpdA
MRIVQISDTHLSHLGGPTNDNLERLIPFVNDQLRPDLVVHSGDVLIADPDSAADRAAARELLSGITAPLRVVPGNHDVGEPGDEPWAGLGTTSARVAAFAGAFGPDHWLELGDYAVIGLNSEVLSTGLPEEQAQWDWLETVPAQAGGRPVLVFSHKPFWPRRPGRTRTRCASPASSGTGCCAPWPASTSGSSGTATCTSSPWGATAARSPSPRRPPASPAARPSA